jgi:predicted amino acid-binding ACT domain protein
MADLILTLIGPDRPGIVESVADVVLERLASDLMVEIRLAEALGRPR